MKKYTVGLILAIIVILAVSYLIKNKKRNIQNQTAQTQQISNITPNPNQPQSQNYSTLSSSLPPTSIDYRAMAEEELKRSELQKTTTGEGLPPVYAQLSGGCNKTIDEILKDYGKVWGAVKSTKNKKGQLEKTFSFSKEENDNFMNIFFKYARCQEIVNRNKEKCYSLIKYGEEYQKTQNICEDDIRNLFFIDYAYAKNSKKYEFCRDYFLSLGGADLTLKKLFSNMKESQFCELAKNGIHNLCDNFVKNGLINSKDIELCRYTFPSNVSDCEKISENDLCFTIIAAMKNDINYCKTEECKWLIQKNCDDIKSQVILTYCNFYNRVEMERREEERKQIAEEVRQKTEESQKKIMKMMKGGKNADTE